MAARAVRRSLAAGLLLLALALVLPPFVNLNRYRAQIAAAVSDTLGRPVTVGDASLRLLPRPGVALTRVVVGEDPAFGAEPMLQAEEMVAALHVSSLWRGRLDVARLSLSYPSLNLVRENGRWNLGPVLARAGEVAAAPTGATQPQSRPRFPYVEATGARINVKVGGAKSAYALSEADFSLWQESEGEWGMRMEGRAVRTDAAISDTGLLRAAGTFRRGTTLRDASLDLRLALRDGQLGQLTKLVLGRDAGWRGHAVANAEVHGTLAALTVQAGATISDFRRYDITGDQNVTLSASCRMRYLSADDVLSDLDCELPSLGGSVVARGSVTRLFSERAYDLTFAAREMPLHSLVRLARSAGAALPRDLSVDGAVNTSIHARGRRGERAQWSGEGAASGVTVRAAALGPDLRIGQAPFVIDQGDGTLKNRHEQAPVRLLVAPFPVQLGAARPAIGSARLTTTGFALELHGDVEVERLLALGRSLGLRAPELRAQGPASVKLDLAGGWRSEAPPSLVGSATVRNVTLGFGGLAAPVQLLSAGVQVTPRMVALDKMNVAVPQTALRASGWLRVPRCGAMPPCQVEFHLTAAEVSSIELSKLLNPVPSRWSWLPLGRDSMPDAFPLRAVHAKGRITVERAAIGALRAHQVTAEVTLNEGVLAATRVRGEVFGGRHTGAWRVDFTGTEPAFFGAGRLERVTASRLAEAMADDWASGTLDLDYKLALSGRSAPQLRSGASGSLEFRWNDAVLKHVVLPGETDPLTASRFVGRLRLNGGVFTFLETRLQTASGVYAVTGTAALDRRLDVRLVYAERAAFRATGAAAESRGFTVTGPLSKPAVAATPAVAADAALR